MHFWVILTNNTCLKTSQTPRRHWSDFRKKTGKVVFLGPRFFDPPVGSKDGKYCHHPRKIGSPEDGGTFCHPRIGVSSNMANSATIFGWTDFPRMANSATILGGKIKIYHPKWQIVPPSSGEIDFPKMANIATILGKLVHPRMVVLFTILGTDSGGK